jgi:hypothetical protein
VTAKWRQSRTLLVGPAGLESATLKLVPLPPLTQRKMMNPSSPTAAAKVTAQGAAVAPKTATRRKETTNAAAAPRGRTPAKEDQFPEPLIQGHVARSVAVGNAK